MLLSAKSQNLPPVVYTAFNICYPQKQDNVENWQVCKIPVEMDWKGDQLSKIIIKTHTALVLTIKRFKKEYTRNSNTHGDLYIAFDGVNNCYVEWEIYDKAMDDAISWLAIIYPKYSIHYKLK